MSQDPADASILDVKEAAPRRSYFRIRHSHVSTI